MKTKVFIQSGFLTTLGASAGKGFSPAETMASGLSSENGG